MNLNCTRLLLRSSPSLMKAHSYKLYKGSPGTFLRLSAPSHSHSISWKGKVPQDSQDDLELFEDAIESNYKNPNIEEITGGDPEKAEMLELCRMEIEISVQKGGRVPKTMTTEYWCRLIEFSSRQQRAHYLRFLWLREERRDNSKNEKMKNYQKYIEAIAIRGKNDRSEKPTNAPVIYGLCDTAMMHRFRDAQINKFYNYKLLQAMMYGPHILVDCGYEDFMSPREMTLCTEDLLFMWFDNRDCRNPFDVIFCNLKETGPIFQKARKALVGFDTDPSFPFNYTDKHYLDLFPRENLVYLTPHCNQYLEKFDGNDIYIIGAMVERTRCEPLSVAKAKKDGIRFAKLPLDLHLNWKRGTKSLTMNQCLAIMNDVKDGRDWSYAFRHVPESNLNDTIHLETSEIRETRHNKSTQKRFRRNDMDDLLLPID